MTERLYFGFSAGNRPAIEVEIGRRWLPGELRSWIRRDCSWWAHIDYASSSSHTHTVTVPAGRIRSEDPRASTPGAARRARAV